MVSDRWGKQGELVVEGHWHRLSDQVYKITPLSSYIYHFYKLKAHRRWSSQNISHRDTQTYSHSQPILHWIIDWSAQLRPCLESRIQTWDTYLCIFKVYVFLFVCCFHGSWFLGFGDRPWASQIRRPSSSFLVLGSWFVASCPWPYDAGTLVFDVRCWFLFVVLAFAFSIHHL